MAGVGTTGIPRVLPGAGTFGGGTGIGTSFKSLTSGAPHAAIKPPKVQGPSRGDYGAPAAAPNIGMPTRGDYGAPSTLGLAETGGAAKMALRGWKNPRGTQAFKEIMGYNSEVTASQAGERERHARDAATRRGYAGGFEDESREAEADRMSALAREGFAGAEEIRKSSGELYGSAIGAFANLAAGYNQAKATGDVSFARDLTQTRIAQAQNELTTLDLNMRQQGQYADALNQARQLQAQLDQQYNSSLIDNNRYIAGQQQIEAQMAAQMAALQERTREFDVTTKQEQARLAEQQRQFDLSLKANPLTAIRTFNDPRYGGGGQQGPSTQQFKRPGSTFASLR